MKIILYFFFPFFIISGISNSFAQENYFTVLAAQGKISLLKSSESKWIDIKTGNKIIPGEKLNVGNNAYIGLVHSSGICSEIKKEGVYDFDQLKNTIKIGSKSPDRKFAEYLSNELIRNAKESEEMKSTGAVVRERLNFIDIGMPSFSLIIDSNLVFKWFSYGNKTNYVFKLINNNNITLFMKVLTDTSLICPIFLFNLNRDEEYRWIVFSHDNPNVSSDTNIIKIPSHYRLGAIRDSIDELNTLYAKDTSAVAQIIYAAFYRNNQLNIEALNAFRRAAQLAPDVDVYKKMFAIFLIKMKLNKMINYSGTGG